MIVVVGSGPAGVACAHALIDRGLSVTLLDGGIELEADAKSRVERLATQRPTEWAAKDLEEIKGATAASVGGVPEKRVYGSDFPYRDAESLLSVVRADVAGRPSLATGGFSNVWGSVVMPFRQVDVADWPITVHDLEPHYRALAKFVPISAREDDLASMFPLYGARGPALRPSRQATGLLEDLATHRDSLREAGIHFGQSRLAVSADGGPNGCEYCAMCMDGCPYGLIYRSTDTLPALMKTGRLNYVKNVVVTRVEEHGNRVAVSSFHRVTRERMQWDASRVFLAAGSIPTTKILLSSMNAYDTPVEMKDSQYFLFPMLRLKGTSGVMNEPLHTLAQAIVELTDPQLSPHTIQLQVYTYNDLFTKALRGLLGPLYALSRGGMGALLGRLFIMQSYLHSKDSAVIQATLKREKSDTLELRSSPRGVTRERIGQVLKKLSRHRAEFGAEPVSLMADIGAAGKGYHFGGAFPMRAVPGPFESDTLGRPQGFSRVHAVDATVLPSIPATTITFSVMANAHRIGTYAERE